ncbi:M1 family metallopeptidase [Fulvivirgaceae bacterium PWU4]|uniref:M1 family metallopeptidase n=1 Tax=Chryseosolibacter histidini TaxID=2782349 RepID=A0AAP2DS29_9BACT|nr:M1 family metallopeptidase [Chryseosolibacter histidini]MBT1701486.1 M1 family metallopeptidase [Chryseosolibacter histidini]
MKTITQIVAVIIMVLLTAFAFAQNQQPWKGKFEQLGETLPTPNSYRTGSGAPGPNYWQQRADYEISAEVDDKTQVLTGSEKITYYNNAPEALNFLWLQLDQNVFAPNNMTDQTRTGVVKDSVPAGFLGYVSGITPSDYKGGYTIKSVRDATGKNLPYTINNTMMRVDLPAPMKTGDKFTFSVDWSYTEYDRQIFNGRGGYEFFPEDGNYVYTFAQWFPRMCVFDDYEGWQNKQFLGQGEFALTFGNYRVKITVPSDHIVGASGTLQNAKDVLTKEQLEKFEKAKKTFDTPVIIVSEDEAKQKEKTKSTKKSTWEFYAENVRDFAFAHSRKFIWDAMAVKVGDKTPLAQSLYPKEGNPLWGKESTKAIRNALEIYSERTIQYPYPVAYSVHTANQGMEYPMICFNGGRPNKDGTYSQQTLFSMVMVIVHEVGHNFFPMIVNSDERQWSWMDEGLNTFLEKETMRVRYPELAGTRGTPKGIVPYMKGEKSQMRPIMSMSDNIRQNEFGPNAYTKPSAALTLLRETVMGPELFDRAFKEYAERWAFKHPKPADFFRTMEDASAVDLDWFWRGWFFTTDNVDVDLSEVKWFRLKSEKSDPEKKDVKVKSGDLASGNGKGGGANDFSNGPQEFTLINTPEQLNGEFKSRVDDNAVRKKLEGKNIYQLKFKNVGGLVTPLVIEWTYKDGSKEIERIPAEIWRINESEITKVFVKEKEVVNIVVDPNAELADVEVKNNAFPKKTDSKFDQFKRNN